MGLGLSSAKHRLKKTGSLVWMCIIVLAQVAIVAPFVPISNILPASFGALTLTALAAALVLAARWRVVDTILGGPDKSYEAHRAAGILSMIGLSGHWALASSAGRGIIPPLAETGEAAGVVSAYAMLILAAVSSLKMIPYHIWKASHWLMGPMFLIAVYHTFLAATPLETLSAPWIYLAVVSVLGLIAWGRTLSRHKSGVTTVSVVDVNTVGHAIELTVAADHPLQDYRPGQFATLRKPSLGEERHPFTIAGGTGRQRKFGIAAGGDWTRNLVDRIRAGDTLELGSPEGRFYPKIADNRPAQIWVAGGIGVTPFLAALEAMKPDDGAGVTMVYCYRGKDTAVGLAALRRHADRLPQLTLIEADSSVAGRLTQDQVQSVIGQMPKGAALFMCGSEQLKAMIATVWRDMGQTGRIHTEAFDFRNARHVSDLWTSALSALKTLSSAFVPLVPRGFRR